MGRIVPFETNVKLSFQRNVMEKYLQSKHDPEGYALLDLGMVVKF
jgi:hypothetical protein